MKVNTKEVRNVVSMLDNIVKEYKEEHPEAKRDWRTYEQRVAERLKTAFRGLKPLVHEAASSIKFVLGETRGAKPSMTVEQRVLALLIKHIIGKSNRNMAAMFAVFSLLSDIDVSYKTVERFYSDPEVIVVLHNLHVLLLKKKGVKSVDGSGDGTGYNLSIKVHYASAAQKLKDKIKTGEEQERKKLFFVYSFTLLDLKSRMYVGTGMSFKSEKEAYNSAIAMAKAAGIQVTSLRLDRYFSNQSDVGSLVANFGKIDLYLIPKSNATVEGPWEWKRMLFRFVTDVKKYLEDYYQRNQSESCFAEDKKRTGWRLGQKRPDRIDTANFLTTIWHNLYWLG
ncbi:MAG: ISNCY family transposase [Candidatus Woesearchaeota archaeon]